MALSRQATGTLLTLTGVTILSPDGLILRLIDADPMSINVWRGSLLAVSLTVWVVLSRRSWRLPGIDRWDCLFAIMFGLSGIAFVAALAMTTIANVMVMASASPLTAALAGALLLKQPISFRTWIALLYAALGICVIAAGESQFVQDPVAPHRSMIGVGLALVSAVFIGIGVVARGKSRDDDSRPAMILGAAIAAVLALPFAETLVLDTTQAMWMSLLGLIILPCAFALVFLGPRYIPASRVALIALLETVLAPIWAWLVLDEPPGALTLVGGGLILFAIYMNITGFAGAPAPDQSRSDHPHTRR